nr:hypothetical protein GCM10020093_108200 [Planobispora longispora]
MRAGLWFGAGLLGAELVLNQIASTGWLPARPAVMLFLPVAAVVTCWWVTDAAELWIRMRPARPMLPVLLAGTVATGVVVFAWLTWWKDMGRLLVDAWSPTPVILGWFQALGVPPSREERCSPRSPRWRACSAGWRWRRSWRT